VRSTTIPHTSAAFVVLLGVLTTLPPLSIDIALPALPAIASALHAPSAAMQATLSVFIFAFGAGQLVMGPLSDRYGRRPVLLAGLTLFTVAGLVCTLTADVRLLIAARVVQGFGACAGTVIARAIVQDVSADRARAASLQGYVSGVTSLAPVIAPLLGAAVLAVLGWRPLYGVLVVAGIALLAAVRFLLPETSPRAARDLGAAYARVLRLPRTIPLALFVSCMFGAYFALISGSPFALVTQMHVPSGLYAAAFALNACALLTGSFGGARVARRVGPERLFRFGVVFAVIAGIATCALDALAPNPVGFVATFALVAFASGIAMPNAYAAALADAGTDAGLASGLLGASQMIGGGIGSAIAGVLPFPPAESIGIVVLVGTLGASAAYAWSRRTRAK
jgi:DHA1 family bicyclomycin/chloramphenicol resistance-like MFS transporter